MRSTWRERHAALRSLAMVLLGAICFAQACGDDDHVARRTEAALEPIALLSSQQAGLTTTGRFDVGHDGSASYVIPV